MKDLNELAEEIVARLVDCESADPEPVEQYKEWTRKQIAEAFRALEQEVQKNLEGALAWQQRAEAAEAECARINRESQNLSSQLGQCDRERRVALAKLAGLVKQKPVGTVSIAMDWNTHRNVATVNMRPDLVVSEMKDGDELFTRPSPAVRLADLVLDEDDNPQGFTAWYERHFATQPYKGASHVTDCENAWRAAILRNIEEANK